MLLFIYLAGSTSRKITVWQHCKAIILQINQSIKKKFLTLSPEINTLPNQFAIYSIIRKLEGSSPTEFA